MTEFATIIDQQGRQWTGIVVRRRPHTWSYVLGLMLTGGLGRSSLNEPDIVTVRLRGEDHSGREKRLAGAPHGFAAR